jgi:crotonobetainyl-CoA:carnitine CoA-transferase CaiB-like acyl-CoA transferase
VAWLANQGLSYLTSGIAPGRLGNAHPSIVPYQAFAASDGYFILCVGNDRQFRQFAELAGAPELATDPRFATNPQRVTNRSQLIPLLEELTRRKSVASWLAVLQPAGVPCGAVNDIAQVFSDPQVRHRKMMVEMPHPGAADGVVRLIANPIRGSADPVAYRRPPPLLGEHTDEVLEEILRLDASERDRLRSVGAI